MSLLPHWSSQHTSLFHSLTRAPRWLIHALFSLLKSLSNSLPTFTDVRAFKLTKKIEPKKKKKKPQKKLSTCSHHYTHLPTCFFAYMLSHPSCYPEELSEFLPKANPRPVDQISFLFASLRITQLSPTSSDLYLPARKGQIGWKPAPKSGTWNREGVPLTIIWEMSPS